MRSRLALLVALVAVLAWVSGSAAAQSIPSAPCGPLQGVLSRDADPAPGQATRVSLQVTNAGDLAVRTNASVSTTAAGWTFDGPPEQTADIPAGQSRVFEFRVLVATDARNGATINIQADGFCLLPGGVACPGSQAQCRAGAIHESAQFGIRLEDGLRFPGLDAIDVPLEFLAGGVALVTVAMLIPVITSRRRRGLVAQCPEPLKLVRPGRGASFPIEVKNRSPQATTAKFDVGPVGTGWTAHMALPELHLEGGETRTLWLIVRAPPTASLGDTMDIHVRVTLAPKQPPREVHVRAEVHPEATESGPANA